MNAHEQKKNAYFSSQRKHAVFLKSIIGSIVIECVGSPYSTRYRKAKARKGLTGSFGDRSWLRKAII